ncbi:hypothetical protein OSTOST_09353, partial [Ostertagia ostertagi]
AVTAKKTSEDYHKSVYEEKITQLQHNQESLLARNDALRKCTDLGEPRITLKNTLSPAFLACQKPESDWSKLEREMREELVVLRKDRLVLTSEVEELKRKLLRAEVEKKEVDGFRARLDREVASLKRHIEALEGRKTRTKAAVQYHLMREIDR